MADRAGILAAASIQRDGAALALDATPLFYVLPISLPAGPGIAVADTWTLPVAVDIYSIRIVASGGGGLAFVTDIQVGEVSVYRRLIGQAAGVVVAAATEEQAQTAQFRQGLRRPIGTTVTQAPVTVAARNDSDEAQIVEVYLECYSPSLVLDAVAATYDAIDETRSAARQIGVSSRPRR